MASAPKNPDDLVSDTASELPFLIRLLDDKDPAVRPIVRERISEMGGDISHDLAALGIEINTKGKKQLTRLLAPGRRETLRNEWLVPSGGLMALEDDWENFENILRQISDFLHDGITLRPSLSDSLDLLVDEITEEIPVPTAEELRQWLFVEGRFSGVAKRADALSNFDLCHVMDSRQGNPTSLAFLFILIGRRVGVQVDGCNYPGHFLARIQIDGSPHLIDCYHAGRHFNIEALLEAHPELSGQARAAVNDNCHLGVILRRYVTELHYTLIKVGRKEDAELFKSLAKTLES
ncbi:MAG: hypothetical protein H7A51_08185 [Akkermansiaceae bacterium]|nr:hypothetical protein [Akkermansiaceae bacterium]